VVSFSYDMANKYFIMLIYLILFVILVVVVLVYFKVADHYNIIDKPNERSSHSYITIRGGGVVFPLAGLLWFVLFGFVPQPLIVMLILSVLVFSFFNARKRAKTFAGDVGSVSLAFLLAWFMIALMMQTGRIEYILFFVVYGIDSVVTILYRMKHRENIFVAHRTHLYQYLSNELRWPHVKVSGIYALVQLGINILTLWLFSAGLMTLPVFVVYLLVLGGVYVIVRERILRKIQLM
jgi:UDP-N-acetylmuramyl pentapeptide phosphotransferase/UDP-N-acetylglucosamine-1-phosphate transferase